MANATDIKVTAIDPHSAAAGTMLDALWDEIQHRYGFVAPRGIDPGEFETAPARFWVAFADDTPIGSIAVKPLAGPVAELDAMYVAPGFRGTGVAQQLLRTLEQHARDHHLVAIRLRAGEPQPEALRFYQKAGFVPIPCFGGWVDDGTARCLEKTLTAKERR